MSLRIHSNKVVSWFSWFTHEFLGMWHTSWSERISSAKKEDNFKSIIHAVKRFLKVYWNKMLVYKYFILCRPFLWWLCLMCEGGNFPPKLLLTDFEEGVHISLFMVFREILIMKIDRGLEIKNKCLTSFVSPVTLHICHNLFSNLFGKALSNVKGGTIKWSLSGKMGMVPTQRAAFWVILN